MSGGATPVSLELELAVARGRDYLVRAVFRPATLVSVGTNPRASITLPDAALPDFHELVTLGEASWLQLESGMRIEMKVDGVLQGLSDLVESGRAEEVRDGYRLPLDVGFKGLVRFGELALLLKVQSQRDATIWTASSGGDAGCGGCGGPLKWALAAPGALSPCPRCGDLNSIGGSIADLEIGVTSVVAAMPRDEMPTAPPRPPLPIPVEEDLGDTVGDAAVPRAKGADLPTFDGIGAMKGAALPTFDAIQANRAGALPPTADALKVPVPATAPVPDPIDRVIPTAGPGRGADLPTFDAISAFKDDGLLSTRAAISVMKGGEPAHAPPVQASNDAVPVAPSAAQIGPQESDAPAEAEPETVAGAQTPTEPDSAVEPETVAEPKPEEDSAEEPDETADGEPPTDSAAATRTAAERLATDEFDQQMDDFFSDVEPSVEREPSTIDRPVPARVPPAPAPAPKPAAEPDDVHTRPHKYAAPTAAAPVPPTKQIPRGVQRVGAPAPSDDEDGGRDPDGTDEGEGDDFLMGRSEGGIRTQPNILGWVLIGFGLMAGMAGGGLILYAALRYKGIL